MQSDRRPLSRRALLKSASVVPLVALGSKVASGEVTTQEAIECVKPITSIPSWELAKVLGKAEKHHKKKSDKPFEKDKAELVALSLWKYFEIGASDAGVDEGVFDHAYDWISGELIVERLGLFGPCGNHATTNVCAYLCGYYAGDEAKKKKQKISKKAYEDAWGRVAQEVADRKKRLETMRGEKFMEEEAIAMLGGGC